MEKEKFKEEMEMKAKSAREEKGKLMQDARQKEIVRKKQQLIREKLTEIQAIKDLKLTKKFFERMLSHHERFRQVKAKCRILIR